MDAILVCGFPGIGKSWLAKHQDSVGMSLLDMDAGDYAWIKDDGGNVVRNPRYPDDYIDIVDRRRLGGDYDFIFIGYQDDIRNCLTRRGVPFVTVAPKPSMKDAYMKKYLNRGDGKDFLVYMMDNWTEMLESIDDGPVGSFKYVLRHESMDAGDLDAIRRMYLRRLDGSLPSHRCCR